MAASQEGSFKIGCALSGAISAGAYTAGVLDYFSRHWPFLRPARTAQTGGGPVLRRGAAKAEMRRKQPFWHPFDCRWMFMVSPLAAIQPNGSKGLQL